MSISAFLEGMGLKRPTVVKRPPDPINQLSAEHRFNCRPFLWDRPNYGIYPNNSIRVYWLDAEGKFEYCRAATAEEAKYITLYEKVEEALQRLPDEVAKRTPLPPAPPPFPEVTRKDILDAMEESGFKRTYSCCHADIKNFCVTDEYKGNLEIFIQALKRILKK